MATREDFVATRSSDLASPPVMLTPNIHGRETILILIRNSFKLTQLRIIKVSGSRQILLLQAKNRNFSKTHESDMEKGRDFVKSAPWIRSGNIDLIKQSKRKEKQRRSLFTRNPWCQNEGDDHWVNLPWEQEETMPMKGTLFLSISIYLACFFDNSFLSLLVNVVVITTC